MLGNVFSLLTIFLITVLLAAPWGYLFFSVWSGVVYWVGKLFKGEGTFQAVRAAYAWSCVPLLINIPLWILLASVFGQDLFSSSSGAMPMNQSHVFLLFSVLIIRLVLSIWSLVIYFTALAEVQHYSVLRAILNVLITGFLLTAAVWVVWTMGLYLIHPAIH